MAHHSYPRSPNILVPLFSQITEYSRSNVGISTVTHYSLAVLSASEFLIIPTKFSVSISRKSTNILVFSEIHQHSCVFRNPRTFLCSRNPRTFLCFRNPRTFLYFRKSTNILGFRNPRTFLCFQKSTNILVHSCVFRNPRTFLYFQKSTNILVIQKSTDILVFSEIHEHSCIFRNQRTFLCIFRNPGTFLHFPKSTNILHFQKSTNILSSLSETGGTLRQSVSG